MTPKALYAGARSAARLALECSRDGELSEALRHRERARWYLEKRARLLRFEFPQKLEQAA